MQQTRSSFNMFIRVNVAEVCDARDDDNSTTAGQIKKKRKKITKVKAVSPSPFYNGKYHPSLLGQLALPYILRYAVS